MGYTVDSALVRPWWTNPGWACCMLDIGPHHQPYCWWFRNPANQLRLVVYPIIYRVLYIPGGSRWCRISSINHIIENMVFVSSCLSRKTSTRSSNRSRQLNCDGTWKITGRKKPSKPSLYEFWGFVHVSSRVVLNLEVKPAIKRNRPLELLMKSIPTPMMVVGTTKVDHLFNGLRVNFFPKDHWTLKTGYFEDQNTPASYSFFHPSIGGSFRSLGLETKTPRPTPERSCDLLPIAVLNSPLEASSDGGKGWWKVTLPEVPSTWRYCWRIHWLNELKMYFSYWTWWIFLLKMLVFNRGFFVYRKLLKMNGA